MNKTKFSNNYRGLLALGIIFLAVGVAIGNPGLMGLGLVFFIFGFRNRTKDQDGES
jgi:hypothetical protein